MLVSSLLSVFQEAPPTGPVQGRAENVSQLSLGAQPTARKGELRRLLRQSECWRRLGLPPYFPSSLGPSL